jgi:hypothetical protein
MYTVLMVQCTHVVYDASPRCYNTFSYVCGSRVYICGTRYVFLFYISQYMLYYLGKTTWHQGVVHTKRTSRKRHTFPVYTRMRRW